MKWLKIIPTLMLFGTGCATVAHPLTNYGVPRQPPELPIAIMFAPDCPYEVQQVIKYGATFWNDELGRKAFVLADYVLGNSIVYVKAEDKQEGSRHLAITEWPKDDSVSIVTVYGFELQTLTELESVARHELGHVLGMDHTDGAKAKGCLMYPQIQWTDSPEDLCDTERRLIHAMYP